MAHHSHPVVTAADEVNATLDGVAGVPVWSMDAGTTRAVLDRFEVAEAKLRAMKSRLLVHAEQVEAFDTLSVPQGLAHQHRLTRREAHRQARVAQGLEMHPLTAAAMRAGAVRVEQAEAILSGLATLPADLDPDVRVRAEEHLIELAQDHDAKALRHLARKILEVVAPDVADAHLAKLLERSAAEDQDANRLHVWATPQGRVKGTFDLDGFSGACLTKALWALSAPRHRAAQGPLGERLTTDRRLGQALAELVRRYPANKLPKAGGLNATVVVLIPYETLIGGLKTARLDTGEHISPGLARRIAASTPEPNASSPPSNKAAASPRDTTAHPPSPTCTTPWSGPKEARPTETAGCSAHQPTASSTTPATPTNDYPTAKSDSTGAHRSTAETSCPVLARPSWPSGRRADPLSRHTNRGCEATDRMTL